MDNETRDSLLIRIDERLQNLEKQFSNHLAHHFWINIALVSIIGGLVVALILK